MKVACVMLVALLSLMLLTSSTDAWIFGSGCGRKCRRAGSSGGRRYTSSATGIKYCLCNGPTRFLPRQKRSVQETELRSPGQ